MKPAIAFLIFAGIVISATANLHAQGCDYIPGDINGNGTVNGIDVTFAVAYFKGLQVPPIDCNPPCTGVPDPFYAAGDVNGDCRFNGIDIVWWIHHGPPFRWCPACPPARGVNERSSANPGRP